MTSVIANGAAPFNAADIIAQRRTQGLKTLGWQQFHRKTGKGPQAYQRYLRYVANASGYRPTNPNDRFAAFRPTPQPVAQRTAQAQAQAAFAPAIGATQQQAQRDQAALRQALQGWTTATMQAMAPYASEVQGIGERTAAALGATGGGLAAAATGQAAEGQRELSDFLSLINAPQASQQFAADAGARGNSIAAGIAAAAQAAQERGIYEGSGLAQLLAAQPRIAEIGGRQQLLAGLRDIRARRDDQLGELRSQRAQTLQEALARHDTNELDKAVALLAAQVDQRNLARQDRELTLEERKLNAELKAAGLPQIEQVGSTIGLIDPATGEFTPTYTAPSTARPPANKIYKQDGSIVVVDPNGNIVSTTKLPGAAKPDKRRDAAYKAALTYIDRQVASYAKQVIERTGGSAADLLAPSTERPAPNYQQALTAITRAVQQRWGKMIPAAQIRRMVLTALHATPGYGPGQRGRPAPPRKQTQGPFRGPLRPGDTRPGPVAPGQRAVRASDLLGG